MKPRSISKCKVRRLSFFVVNGEDKSYKLQITGPGLHRFKPRCEINFKFRKLRLESKKAQIAELLGITSK